MRLLDYTFYVIIVFLTRFHYSEAYRILGVFPFNAKSHSLMFEALMKELATRGHQVDVVGHYPLKEPFPNYNDIIDLSNTLTVYLNNLTYEFGKTMLKGDALVIGVATSYGGDLCDLMDKSQLKRLIEKPPQDPPYDLVIVEAFGSPCYYALGQHLNVPIVGLVTSPMWPWVNDMVANPDNTAYIPHAFSDINGKMDFWDRFKNTVTLLRAKYLFKHYSAYQDEKIKKHFGPDAPSLVDVEKNISLILVNSHYSLQGVRPFTNAVVEVGGLHIREDDAPLPNDLREWLNNSSDGFVYVSFGSMLKIESFPEETLAALYSSLKKLSPIRALIKVANRTELPPGLPSNVKTLPWIPQTAVLQHKNVRAFMTHGGLFGIQEAVHFAVPMIGVPVFGDQPSNIDLCVKKNIAVSLSLDQLTEENFDSVFNAVLHDPSYRKSMKEVSSEFRDRPMTAADTAVYWIEYVVRHGGASIRSPALDLAWWQIALLDVYGALALAIAVAIYFSKLIVSKILKKVSENISRTSLVDAKKHR